MTTEEMTEVSLGISNFDHTIDKRLEEKLRENPNKVHGRHAAMNFNGLVWFDGHHFIEEVYIYQNMIEVIREDSLEELMITVNDKYGYE